MKLIIKENSYLLKPGVLLLGLCFSISAQQAEQLRPGAATQETVEQRNAYSTTPHALAKNNPPLDLLGAPPPPSSAGSSLRPTPASIVENFIAAERKFRETLIQFSFKRDVVLETIGPGGEVTGEYIRNSVFALDD